MSSRLTRAYLAIALALMALALGRPALAISIVPITLQDTIHEADAIFTGRVLQAQSRWGTPEQRWMVTDYLFQIDDAILPSGEVQTGGQIVLTWPGGSINGLNEGIRGLELPRVGNSYLLMLRKDWKEPRMGPEVFPNQGLFRLVQPKGSATVQIQESEGQPLFKLANGMIVRGRDVKGAPGSVQGVAISEFKTWLRANMARIKATPIQPHPFGNPNDPYAIKTFSKVAVNSPIVHGRVEIPESEMRRPNVEDVTGKHPIPAVPEDIIKATGPDARPMPGPAPSVMTGPSGGQTTSSSGTLLSKDVSLSFQYSFFNTIPSGRLRIVWNQFPTDGSFSPWSPEDQYQMSKWDHWSDIHWVRTTPTGTWAWQNGRYDQCGWPDNTTMINQFGQGWGGSTLAVCWSRWDASGLLESDIAFNPAYSWTLNDAAVYDNSTSAWPFRATMVHELAHAHGQDHIFDFMTIMNYQDKVFRMFGFPYMDDAEAIRAVYPGYAPNHYNLANYLYYSAGYQNWNDFTKSATYVTAGNNITFDDYHVENVGNYNLPDTPIYWYITPNRDYSGSYYYIGSTDFGALNRFFYFTPESVDRTFTIPSTANAGWYYVNTWMPSYADTPGQGDFPFSNRYAWSRTQIYVYPRLSSVVVSPSISPRNSTATGYVYFNQASDGRYVSLSSSDTSVATVPSSVYVYSGDTWASFPITIQGGSTPGTSLISATSNGVTVSDTAYASARTNLTAANVTGALGQTVTLSAVLRNDVTGAYVANEYVYFYVNGDYAGYGLTNASGKASKTYKIEEALGLGTKTIEAYHYTNANYYYSYDAANLTVNKANTKLTFTDQTVQMGKTATLKGTLKRATDNAALAGYTITFVVNGVTIGSAATNASGVAQITHKFDEPYGLGAVACSAGFAGSANYNASSDPGTITVVQSPTRITIRTVSGARGTTVKLLAYVQRTSDSKYLNGHVLSFYVDSAYVGDATMASNIASRSFFIPTGMSVGYHNVRVDYAGSTFYTASTKNGSHLNVK